MPTLSLSKNQGSRAGTCDIYHILLAGARLVLVVSVSCALVALAGRVRHVCLLFRMRSGPGPGSGAAAFSSVCSMGRPVEISQSLAIVRSRNVPEKRHPRPLVWRLSGARRGSFVLIFSSVRLAIWPSGHVGWSGALTQRSPAQSTIARRDVNCRAAGIPNSLERHADFSAEPLEHAPWRYEPPREARRVLPQRGSLLLPWLDR